MEGWMDKEKTQYETEILFWPQEGNVYNNKLLRNIYFFNEFRNIKVIAYLQQ